MNRKVIDYGAYSAIMDALDHAKTKHPVFPADRTGGLAIISEEMLELTQAINDGESNNRCIEEAAHVAVTAIRFIEGILNNELQLR